MKTYIVLIFVCVISLNAYSQFSEEVADQLSAFGMHRAIEPDNYAVKMKANEIMEKYPGDYVKQFCAVFDYLFRGWDYRIDPGGMEYFREAAETIETMTGDCDDYAILMNSLVMALGGDGRIVCVSGHAYPELYLGKDVTEEQINFLLKEIKNYYSEKGYRREVSRINYHKDYDGTYWLNMDYQQWHPGGYFIDESPGAEHLVIYSSGEYRRGYLNSE